MILNKSDFYTIQMALQSFIEDKELAQRNPNYNFNPEARTLLKEMINSAKNTFSKIKEITGIGEMPNYQAGDEEEFLTKES